MLPGPCFEALDDDGLVDDTFLVRSSPETADELSSDDRLDFSSAGSRDFLLTRPPATTGFLGERGLAPPFVEEGIWAVEELLLITDDGDDTGAVLALACVAAALAFGADDGCCARGADDTELTLTLLSFLAVSVARLLIEFLC